VRGSMNFNIGVSEIALAVIAIFVIWAKFSGWG